MKIQYCSDLHLEFPENWNWLKRNPLIPKGDILIVAGDTFHLGHHFKDHPFFEQVSKDFDQVFLIPGNHEFYGGFDAEICLETDYEYQVKSNVFLVNNTSRIVHGTKFIFTTLWSKIEKEVHAILNGMNDFKLIRFKNKKLSIESYNELFQTSWQWLQKEISTSDGLKTIVATHHLPSLQCNVPEFMGSLLNEGFCVDLTNEIAKSQVDYWIYGHSHRNKAPFKIEGTEMLSNQLGYVFVREGIDFDRERMIGV